MICYPPTTLPPSPLFSSVDEIIRALCDECLMITYSDDIEIIEKLQAFEYTMRIIDFWEEVKRVEVPMCNLTKET